MFLGIEASTWAKFLAVLGAAWTVISGFALAMFNWRLSRWEGLRREEREQTRAVQKEERERTVAARKAELERTLVPRTQFDMMCRFFGPEGGKIIVDLQLIAENKGQTIRGFKSIKFDIFGMKVGEQPTLYLSRDGANRLQFNGMRRTEEINYVFSVEPGIRQVFPLTTIIDADIKYIIVKVEVEAAQWGDNGSSWFGERRFFPVVLEAGSGAPRTDAW